MMDIAVGLLIAVITILVVGAAVAGVLAFAVWLLQKVVD